MKTRTYGILTGLLVSVLSLTVSCQSTSSLSGNNTGGNLTNQYSDDNSQSIRVTDASLPLIDYIRKLQGVRVSGFGSNYQVNIRGQSRLLGNTNPLFVIDGVPLGQSYIDVSNAVSMSRVNSIRVIKGSELTLRFGPRGSNGVIEILTRNSASF